MGRHSIPDPEDTPEDSETDHLDVAGPRARGTTPLAEPDDTFAEFDPYLAEPTDAPPPEESGSSTAAARRTASGEWTGSHRVVKPHRRGVSPAVIAALATVVVLVGGIILWRFFGDALSERSGVAAARCVEGEAKVAVLADPAIADTIGKLATTFNENAGPVGDHCVTVSVAATDADGVVAGLTGTWPESLGDKPALWIPGSSVATARLQAAAGPSIVSASRSLATSPVLLATRPALKDALAQQNWATLPGLQSNPAGLDGLGLAGWGPLRLALPKSGNSDAAYLAAEAVASAAAPPGAPTSAGVGAVNTLAANAPKLDNDSLDAAMTALLDGDDQATAPVHAVALTEQQLFARASSVSDAASVVAGWLPPGPVAIADFPAVLLAGDWVDEAQTSAASEFERFLQEPDQRGEFAQRGFRVEGANPPAGPVTPFESLPPSLNVGDDGARTAVANALSSPATGGTTTIMLGQSLNLPPVVDALKARLGALGPAAAVGLTTFDSAAGTTRVSTGPLADPVDGTTRGQLLDTALDSVPGSGPGGVSFTTLRNVYADALTNFRPGQANSVLVITAGPHTDQTLGSEGLQELIRSSADPARPVAVNVINLGDDPDRPTWEAVAQISGGTYQNVQSSASPEFTAAIASLLN